MPQKLVNSMFEEQRTVRQMIYQRGKESSPHYIFLHSDDESSGDDESISLQNIKRSTLGRRIEVINVQISSEDTLQALALRYRCTISELKRINKIDKENEIYAKPFIKVPVQPFSLLTETLSENQGNIITSSAQCGHASVESDKLIDVDNMSTSTETKEINTIILNSVCEPLSSYNSANSFEVSHTEHDYLLGDVESTEVVEPSETDIFKCSGDNWGLSWKQLLLFSLLLSFAGPIIYVLYIAEYAVKTNVTVSD